jgi:hypothetical protein
MAKFQTVSKTIKQTAMEHLSPLCQHCHPNSVAVMLGKPAIYNQLLYFNNRILKTLKLLISTSIYKVG